jgi:transporter family-2 protein
MTLLIGLALLNGVLIATGRAINGHLGRNIGVIRTALWVHAVGFLFLSAVIVTGFLGDLAVHPPVPPIVWCGGLLGVVFVALNALAVSRLGVGRTTCFVVAAQMLASMVLDSLNRPTPAPTLLAMGGSGLIIAGVWLSAQ